MFYVFRAVAGIGGGGITNIAMIIVSDVVTLKERGKYQGFIGSSTGLGNVIGPFLAAAFIATATWRATFWMLSPLAIICAAATWFLLPSKPPQASFREGVKKIDYMGMLTMSIGVIFILIPVSGVSKGCPRLLSTQSRLVDQRFQGGAYFPWDSPMTITMLAVGSLSMGLFVLVEWRFSRLPMMPCKSCLPLVLVA